MGKKSIATCVKSSLLWLYRLMYVLSFVFVIPVLLWKRFVQGKREHIQRRLFPTIRYPVPGSGPLIWVHAVSVGEVHAVAPVVKTLLKERPAYRVVVSTITQTGHETARRVIPDAQAHVFLPFDLAFSIRRSFSLGIPSLVLFSEGDVWPLFAHEAKKRGAIIALVNGKISDRTMARLSKVSIVGRWLYSFVDLFCVQNQLCSNRFIELGVAQETVHVTGNTKADVAFTRLTPPEMADLREAFGLRTGDRLLVLASTHSSEEDQLLSRLDPLKHRFPDMKIAIVPRHPERFSEVFHRAKAIDQSTALFSAHDGSASWRLMVVDKLGVLGKVYQIATVAIVCGSFTDRIGGHNILEPAVAGVPVIVGPFMHSQPTLFSSAMEAKAIFQVSYETVADMVDQLFRSEPLRKKASEDSVRWAEGLRGATDRTVRLLLEKMNELGTNRLKEDAKYE